VSSLNPEHPPGRAAPPRAGSPPGGPVAGIRPTPDAAVLVVAFAVIAVCVALAARGARGLPEPSTQAEFVMPAIAASFLVAVAAVQFLAVFRRSRAAANLMTTLCLATAVFSAFAFSATVGEIIFEPGSPLAAVPALGFHATLAGCATAAGVVNRRWGTQLRHRPRPGLCLRCGYNLTGNLSGVCPECGAAVVASPSNAPGAVAADPLGCGRVPPASPRNSG
jgi:hypothetical protein